MFSQIPPLADWLLWALTGAFLLSAAFYAVRLFGAETLRRLNGYWDWENEMWHMLCLLGMAAMFSPVHWLGVPVSVWQGIFAVGAGWYAIRALTWGRRLSYNKQWYDWAHSGMLLGMWWMFAGLVSGTVAVTLNIAFWAWFAGYYFFQTAKDVRNRSHGWTHGQNVAHLGMGLMMIAMVIFPTALMPAHAHHNTSAPLLTVLNTPSKPALQQGKVAILVFGGCANCSQELRAFREVEKDFPNLRFEVVHKDDEPQLTSELGVSTCPVLLLVVDGKVVEQSSNVLTADELRALLSKLGN